MYKTSLLTSISLILFFSFSKAQELEHSVSISYVTEITDETAFEKAISHLLVAEKAFNGGTSGPPGPSMLRLYLDPRQNGSNRQQKRKLYTKENYILVEHLYDHPIDRNNPYAVDSSRSKMVRLDSLNQNITNPNWRNMPNHGYNNPKPSIDKSDRKIINGYSCFKVIVILDKPFTINNKVITKINKENVMIEMYVTEELSKLNFHPAIPNIIDLTQYFPVQFKITDKNLPGMEISGRLLTSKN